MQLTYFTDFASGISIDKSAFAGDNQDALRCYIDAYGPEVNMFVSY